MILRWPVVQWAMMCTCAVRTARAFQARPPMAAPNAAAAAARAAAPPAATAAVSNWALSIAGRGRASACGPLALQQPEARVAETGSTTEKRLHLTFVTGNMKKLEEVKMIIESTGMPITIVNRNIDLPEIQGDPVLISQEKCRLAAQEVGGAVMVEDTSLCFTALNGMPGPYIKWFMEAIGNQGIYNMLAPYADKSAYAQCSLSFSAGPRAQPLTFVGRAEGTIQSPTGVGGFGWDAIFLPHGHDVTFACMERADKNRISHRARALAQFSQFLVSNMDRLLEEVP